MKALKLLRESFLTLKRNEPLILASATSFFATFSLSPIIVIMINLLGLYFRNDEIRKQLIGKVEGMFGPETSRYIEGIVKNVTHTRKDWLVAIFGFIFLFFVSTTLLKVVKQAIHKIWQIKRRHVSKLKYNFTERSIAVGIILIMGILIGVSVLLDTSLVLLHGYLREQMPAIQVTIIRALNILFSLVIGTAWFTILLKVLPDARVHWRVALAGGLLTATLFNSGKWILGKLLLYNTLAHIFGPSASFVLILLFIFYSSFILYYGAAFTYTFAQSIHLPIHAGKFSEEYEVRAVTETIVESKDDEDRDQG
jgi:membrane protein